MSEKKNRPNCYECVHRGTLPGSAHSSCKHPANAKAAENPMGEFFAIMAGVGRAPPIQADTGLNIKGNAHGIKSGWFNWPYNFDPVWLDSCDGFEAKDAEVMSVQAGRD